MRLILCALLSLGAIAQTTQISPLDYMYYFPNKGEGVVELSLLISADEMEFDNKTSGVEEVLEVERTIMTLDGRLRYALSSSFLVHTGVEWEFYDIETHLEDELANEYPLKSPFKVYNPEFGFRYRIVDRSEVFIDLDASYVYARYNTKHSPLNRTVNPFEGQNSIQVNAVVGMDFGYFRLMNSVGTLHHEGGMTQFEFGQEELDSEESDQVLLTSIIQVDFSPVMYGSAGFSFYSADAFDLNGPSEFVKVEQSTQKNVFLELGYTKYQNNWGILKFTVNQRIDRYILRANNTDTYEAEHSFLDFIFKLEKWF